MPSLIQQLFYLGKNSGENTSCVIDNSTDVFSRDAGVEDSIFQVYFALIHTIFVIL